MIVAHAKHPKTSNVRPISPVGRPFKKLISNPEACSNFVLMLIMMLTLDLTGKKHAKIVYNLFTANFNGKSGYIF